MIARRPPAPERQLLDERRNARAMSWIMAIMLFLTVLAAALGLSTWSAARSLDSELAGRLTVQLVEGDAATRDRAVAAVLRIARRDARVTRAVEVDRARLVELLEPWLGEAGLDADLPMPAMIDIDVRDPAATAAVEAAIRAAVPTARVDRHAQWLAPVRGLVATLAWLAAGVVLLVAGATTFVVLLAARTGLDTHRDTIEVLHMLGSTDFQVARLFQRRIAIDTLTGGVIGATAALAFLFFLGRQLDAVGAEIVGGVALSPGDWAVLAVLPLVFTLMATLAARLTVLKALGKRL
ncbi:cell division protein FtsX [Sphingomonas baiyangensis]|uniref:FtsX-like permease family protein n=1 Tax=Sphingomonas baiyangensis TaxID=2572576 RepID=A0A4U1L433_9SPHN|nr:FtsX-like permease family protein [Sphingomonas baiyangensis]TKD51677.1 FtsX-like permease family protein [Sphingomonas baiyangensis]